jgi:hypothetical protein
MLIRRRDGNVNLKFSWLIDILSSVVTDIGYERHEKGTKVRGEEQGV